MIIFTDSRRSGKTDAAIKMAASTHARLIVPSSTVKIVEQQAQEMGYPVMVVGAKEYFSNRFRDIHTPGRYNKDFGYVVIDELDWILRELFGAEVIMATTTGITCEIEVKENPAREYPIFNRRFNEDVKRRVKE